MKKKCLYGLFVIFGFLSIFIPINANALTVTPTLSCTSNVNKNSTVTCTVTVNVVDGTLGEFTANLFTDGKVITSSSSSVSSFGAWTGKAKILTFTVSSTDKSGTGNVMLSNFSVTDSEGNKGTISGGNSISKGVKVLNDDSTLRDIKINYAALPGFSPVKKNYSITANSASINVGATKNDDNATLTGAGTKKLSCGTNKVSLVVKAQDGSKSTYTLNIKRNCNNDATLTGITLSSGSLMPTFDKSVKEYKASVGKDVDKITINATKANPNQEVTGIGADKKLEFGENKFAIKVKAEDGTTNVYNLVITREDSRSNNTALSSITLSEGNIEFSPDTTEYETKVLNSVTSIDVAAVAQDPNSKVEVTGGKELQVGENTILIKVTSEKGEEKEYKILVTRLNEGETLGDNPNIKNISITGYTLDFLSTTTEYNLKIGKESTLSISVELEDPTGKYEILGNSDLKDGSVITIRVTSADGTVKDYKITIEKSGGYMLYAIISGISFAFAIILIIYLVVKTKKSNDGFDADADSSVAEENNTQVVVDTPVNNPINNGAVNNEMAATITPNVPTVNEAVQTPTINNVVPNPVDSTPVNPTVVGVNPVPNTPAVSNQTVAGVAPVVAPSAPVVNQGSVTPNVGEQIPVTPAPVAQPTPVEPVVPVQSAAPVEPVVPVQPVAQAVPVESVQPVVPATPAAPVADDKQISLSDLVKKTSDVAADRPTEEIPSVASVLAKASAPATPAAVKKCTVCGHEVPADADKCPFCKVSL